MNAADRIPPDQPVLLFDGVCNLCHASVLFIIARDPGAKVRFASLQSRVGQGLFARHHLSPKDWDSVVLVIGGRSYTRSAAALRVLCWLKMPWPLASALLVIPPFLRDAVYRWVAANRYRWFGRKDQCLIPAAGLKARFLDGDEAPPQAL